MSDSKPNVDRQKVDSQRIRKTRVDRIRNQVWPFAMSVLIAGLGFLFAEARRMEMVGSPWISIDMTDHLGAEYNNIAVAIYEGRGFSDPFGRGDGPTAWVPPLLPGILSGLYWISDGSRETVVMLSRLLQVASLAVVLFLMLQPLARVRRRVIAIVTLVAVLAHFRYLFQLTHDHVLLIVLATLMWRWFCRSGDSRQDKSSRAVSPKYQTDGNLALRSEGKKTAILSGIGGGVLALASPVLGMVWAVLTTVQWRRSPVLVGIAAVVSMLIVAPWIVRNRIVLDAWIPIKSNAAYEFWQAQVVDEDGVVDVSLGRTHPYSNGSGEDALAYTKLGEMKLLAQKHEQWIDALNSSPMEVITKIGNRCSAALIEPIPYTKWDTTRTLAWTSKRIWVIACSLSVLVILWLHPIPISREIKFAFAIWALFLTPYLLCSYYERYDIVILPMRLFVLLSAVLLLCDKIFPAKRHPVVDDAVDG